MARARRNQESVRIEPVEFYVDLITSARRMKRSRWLEITALMVISQLANAVGFAVARTQI